MPKTCTADSTCLSLLVFTQLFSEVAPSQLAKPARKQNSTRNSQSRSCILGSLRSRLWTAYRCIITLASSLKYSKKLPAKTLKLDVFDYPTVVWRRWRPPRGTSANIPYKSYTARESLAYIFVADSVGLPSFKFLWWAPKDASFLQQSAYRPLRSLIMAPIESACDFLLVINNNHVPILPRFRDTAGFLLRTTHPIPPEF